MPDRPSPIVRFLMMIGRIFVFTLGFAALGMGLGLMVGIVYLMVSSGISHAHPDMSQAYWMVAIPLAAISGGVAFIYTLAIEIRTAGRTHA